MKKHYVISFIVYGILAACFGVFYREFTKFMGFDTTTSITTLSYTHVHYFVLGVVFSVIFLVLYLHIKEIDNKNSKLLKIFTILYHVGLNITGIMMTIRGTLMVLENKEILTLTESQHSVISGISGIGHVILGVSLITLLIVLGKNLLKKKEEN